MPPRHRILARAPANIPAQFIHIPGRGKYYVPEGPRAKLNTARL